MHTMQIQSKMTTADRASSECITARRIAAAGGTRELPNAAGYRSPLTDPGSAASGSGISTTCHYSNLVS